MYRAKDLGRNGYAIFDAELDALAPSSLSIQVALRRALAREELSLLYLPQVDGTTGALVAVEALLR